MTETPAIAAARAAGIAHEVVDTGPVRSLEEAAAKRGVAVGAVIKTLVVRRGEDDYVLVLVPGDRTLDWPKLRALLGVRRLSLPDADEAQRATGYARGTITPFGARGDWPVIVDRPVLDRERVSIGGGAHGMSLMVDPHDIVSIFDAQVADVT